VELEQRQLDRYRQRVTEANDLGLPDVAEALRPLLQQTQDHGNCKMHSKAESLRLKPDIRFARLAGRTTC
jgi:hypothetical protein